MTSPLPTNVRALLETRVDTFEKLELIVTLHRAPRSVMSMRELAAALKVDRDGVRRAAIELRDGALVELTTRDEVQLLPPTSGDHAAVSELARLYQEDRLAIVKALGESALERVRAMAMEAFADTLGQRKKP